MTIQFDGVDKKTTLSYSSLPVEKRIEITISDYMDEDESKTVLLRVEDLKDLIEMLQKEYVNISEAL